MYLNFCNLIYQKHVFEPIIDRTFDMQRERESLICRVLERLGALQQLTHSRSTPSCPLVSLLIFSNMTVNLSNFTEPMSFLSALHVDLNSLPLW